MLTTDAMHRRLLCSKFRSAGPRHLRRRRVCRDELGTLAGTGLDMATAVRNAVALLGLEIAEAARIASELLPLPWG